MPLVIVLDNNNNHEYNNFNEIPQNMFSNIKALKCNNCNLYNIDFIANFINLKKLNASFNKITQIPIVSNLEELDIYNNELVELPILINLKKLYAFNNKLKAIPFLPNLEIIDVSHNNISKISLGKKIQYIYVGFNRITQIELSSTDVLEIECNNNELTNVNFIYGLNKLKKINYKDNPISYEPPYIKRFISNHILRTNSIHPINNNVEKQILKLLDKKPNMNYQRLTCDILNNDIIYPTVKKILLSCLNEKNIFEQTLRINMVDLFLNLWTVIKRNNLFDKLNILLSNKCKCISCMFNEIIQQL
jgi:hypothetical protein